MPKSLESRIEDLEQLAGPLDFRLTDEELEAEILREVEFLTIRATEQGLTDTSLTSVLAWWKGRATDPEILEFVSILEAGNERRAMAHEQA